MAAKLTCKLDLTAIDTLDEISGDEQLALVWCDTHRKFEWHWLPIEIATGTVRWTRLYPAIHKPLEIR